MTAAATDPSVRVERDGAVATLVLNEPRSMNAMSAGIKAGIEDNLPGLLADPQVRAIVITGTGKASVPAATSAPWTTAARSR